MENIFCSLIEAKKCWRIAKNDFKAFLCLKSTCFLRISFEYLILCLFSCLPRIYYLIKSLSINDSNIKSKASKFVGVVHIAAIRMIVSSNSLRPQFKYLTAICLVDQFNFDTSSATACCLCAPGFSDKQRSPVSMAKP